MKKAFPAKAKMTAFVCSGRRRPKVSSGGMFTDGSASWRAIRSPTSMPTSPQMNVASMNLRAIASS